MLAAPVMAEEPMPPPAENYKAMSGEKLGAQLRSADTWAEPCARAVPILAELQARQPELMQLNESLAHARINCAGKRKAYAEAYGELQRLEAAGGEVFPPQALYLAVATDDGAETNARFRAVLQSGDPKVRDALGPDLVGFAIRAARQNGSGRELEEMLASEMRAGLLYTVDPDVRPIFAINALGAVARDGDIELARRLIHEIHQPPTYARLLADRQFTQLWPLLEERVGPGFQRITRHYKERSLGELEAESDDTEALSQALHALYYAGEFAQVIEMADAATGRPDLADTLDEDEGWALNLKAYALDALGRQTQADAVFDLIGDADGEDDYWRVNFAINRASRLVGQGRWEEGLVAAEQAAEVAREHGSPYARALILRDRICALNSLDRTEEALLLVDDLRLEAEQHAGLLAEGLLCLDQEKEAVDVLLAALGDEQLRRSLIDELQDDAFDMFYTRSILPKPRDLLERDKSLRQAYLQYARMIPTDFYPAASLMR